MNRVLDVGRPRSVLFTTVSRAGMSEREGDVRNVRSQYNKGSVVAHA